MAFNAGVCVLFFYWGVIGMRHATLVSHIDELAFEYIMVKMQFP